jgi:hypothetical protein
MPITYVRYIHSKTRPDWYHRTFEEYEEENVLLFDAVSEGTVTPIGELYRRLDPGLRTTELVVFRGSGQRFLDALERDATLPDLLREKRGLALVGTVTPESRGPGWYRISCLAPPAKDLNWDQMRWAELEGILRRNQAIFESDQYHYGLPSGAHAKNFIRLGDALRSVFDVNRLAEWILPFLTERTVIVGDTGSMLPLMLRLREQAETDFRWQVELATLDRYPRETLSVADAIEAVLNRPMVVEAKAEESALGYLFLISVSSTGDLCRLLRELAPAGSKIVVVCQTTKDAIPCDCALVTVLVEKWKVEDDGECKECKKTHVLDIHPESYELLPKIKWDPVIVDKDVAAAKADFWTMTDEADAVQLNIDVEYPEVKRQGTRHFGVLLDTPKLGKHDGFRRRCVEVLKKADRPQLIFIPEHKNSWVVHELCELAHPGCPRYPVAPGKLSAENQERLRGIERVLVADDAIVTGVTLFYLRNEIFRAAQEVNSSPEMTAFVMVSRPADDWLLNSLKNRYRNSKQVLLLRGEHVYLPEGRNCPWREELDLLNSFRQRLDSNSLALLEERIAKLERPLEPPLLMVNPKDSRGNLQSLGTFFGYNLRAKAAFAAGVCAAQTVKQKLGTLGGGLQFKVADLGKAYGCYFEGVLLSSLLRTFHAVHLRCPSFDHVVAKTIKDIRSNIAYPGVLTELALAAIAGKVPGKIVREAVVNWRGEERWLKLLGDILEIAKPT